MLPCSPSNDMRRKMKIKSIIAGFGLTIGSLFIMVSPAQAETCSTGTYTVAGINTFGGLPCSDPGTEINVTVRGLHDYGVPGGPTAYCSFIYVRKNLGTVSSPNWSASTDTICDPKPTPPPAPVVVPTPTPSAPPSPAPSPTPSATPEPTQYCQGNVCSTTPPKPTDNGGFAVVDADGVVHGVIVGNIDYFGGNDKVMQTEYMGCPVGCKIILQTPAQTNGNVYGYISSESSQVTYSSTENTFTVKQDGVVVQKIAPPEINKTESSTVLTTVGVLFSETATVTTDGSVQNLTVPTLTASEITATNSSVSIVNEILAIDQKVTEQEAVIIINNSTNRIMQSKIDRLIKLLGDWFL